MLECLKAVVEFGTHVRFLAHQDTFVLGLCSCSSHAKWIFAIDAVFYHSIPRQRRFCRHLYSQVYRESCFMLGIPCFNIEQFESCNSC